MLYVVFFIGTGKTATFSPSLTIFFIIWLLNDASGIGLSVSFFVMGNYTQKEIIQEAAVIIFGLFLYLMAKVDSQ